MFSIIQRIDVVIYMRFEELESKSVSIASDIATTPQLKTESAEI
jgi:hypothetical protein